MCFNVLCKNVLFTKLRTKILAKNENMRKNPHINGELSTSYPQIVDNIMLIEKISLLKNTLSVKFIS